MPSSVMFTDDASTFQLKTWLKNFQRFSIDKKCFNQKNKKKKKKEEKRCLWFKYFFPLSLMARQNKLECLLLVDLANLWPVL